MSSVEGFFSSAPIFFFEGTRGGSRDREKKEKNSLFSSLVKKNAHEKKTGPGRTPTGAPTGASPPRTAPSGPSASSACGTCARASCSSSAPRTRRSSGRRRGALAPPPPPRPRPRAPPLPRSPPRRRPRALRARRSPPRRPLSRDRTEAERKAGL